MHLVCIARGTARYLALSCGDRTMQSRLHTGHCQRALALVTQQTCIRTGVDITPHLQFFHWQWSILAYCLFLHHSPIETSLTYHGTQLLTTFSVFPEHAPVTTTKTWHPLKEKPHTAAAIAVLPHPKQPLTYLLSPWICSF